MRYSLFFLLVSLVFFVPVSCVDKDFDQPPAGGEDPNLATNLTIAELKAMHTLSGFEEITEDYVIDAIVISDDEAGNFFRQLVVADETGGIEIRIDMTDLHTIYPVGRKIYIKAKGLWLGDYNGLTQLGAGTGFNNQGELELVRIPESIVRNFIVNATFGHPVVPTVLGINEITDAHVSTLVQFNDVQFVAADAGQTYADAVLQQTLNREVEDCSRRRLTIRSSGFASFAGTLTPSGKGTLIGVLGKFGDTYQITIRDLGDVDMVGERCTAATLTIGAVKQLFQQGTTTVPGGTIKGVVISDYTTQNVTGRNVYIQDGTDGIVLRFDANHNFPVGSQIEADVSGGTLIEFNGLLQIEAISVANALVVGNPGGVTPRLATVQDVLTNAQTWESTLVRIENVVLSAQATFNGEVVVTDASGSMIMFTRSAATFSGTPLPSGEVDVIAIVSEFNNPQLIIRSPADVIGGSTGSGDIDESFSSLSNNSDINLPGWANIAVKGTRLWRAQVFSGNTYAQATAFNDTGAEMEAWLITPPIDLTEAKKIGFESAKAFWTHAGLSVWISSDFNGTDVTAANWQELTPTLAAETDTEHAFIPSGDVSLSGFTGPVRIGFKYVGSGPDGLTTSFRIDNVKVEKL